jgi:hypothetical protein
MSQVQITVEYVSDITEMSDVSPKFSLCRNFRLNMSRNFRNFECVATHSLTRDIFSICRESMECVGLLFFFANLKCVRGFRGRGWLFFFIISLVKCERAREV